MAPASAQASAGALSVTGDSTQNNWCQAAYGQAEIVQDHHGSSPAR
jgi:hypothetical protein